MTKHIILARNEDAGRKWAAEVGLVSLTPSVWIDKKDREFTIVTQRHVMLGMRDAVFYKAGWVGEWLINRAAVQARDFGCRWATLEDYRELGVE